MKQSERIKSHAYFLYTKKGENNLKNQQKARFRA